MKHLKNWDNKTWLSSSKYIHSFSKFLNSKFKMNKTAQILDVGCGRGNIISFLQKKYRFEKKPVGLDVVKNKNVKKNIFFLKTDAIKYLKKTDKLFDLILIKQTIHFFSNKQILILLNLAKKKLNKNGQILIFSLKTSNNQIPSFKLMKLKLKISLKKDEALFKRVKKNLRIYDNNYFEFRVSLTRSRYIKMLKNRYISCLLKMSNKEIKKGVEEIKSIYKNKIIFTDTLNCISYKK